MSASRLRGLSSRPGFTQQWEGVQGRFAPLLRHAAEAARPNLNMLKKGMALHRGSIQALHPAVQCSNIGTPEAFVVKLWA